MTEHFYLGIYWPARRRSLSQCREGESVQRSRELTKVDGRLAQWFLKGWTRAHALQHQVSLDDQSIAKLLLDGRNRTDYDNKVIENLGFSMAFLWNGATAGNEVAISTFIVGAIYSKWVGNNAILDLPFSTKARW